MNIIFAYSIKDYARFNILCIFVITLCGCVSVDHKNVEKECESYASKIYPPKYEDIDSSETKRKDLIASVSSCDEAGNTLKCDKSKSEDQIDNKIEFIDSNAKARNDYILNCIIKTCKERFGNSQCKSQ